jgi:uncharacterized protein YaaQ
MELVLGIVQSEDADTLCKRLNAEGFRVTRVNTVGGFLARGNVTILTGVEEEQVDQVIEIIRNTCHTRRSFINPTPLGTEPVHLAVAAPAMPLEVLIGGATVFSFPLKQFVRGVGGPAPRASGEPEPAADRTPGATHMNLMLAFVQNEDAEPITRALLEASYRVTRINTAGAFLRRGNVTLLIGVEEDKVDDVIRIIQAKAQVRTEASPLSTGMPGHSATIFVLEASRLVRV